MAVLEKNYFDKNLSLLKDNHAHLIDRVSQHQIPSQKTTLVYAENGKPNLRVETGEGKQVMIHDINDPGIESETFLSLVPEDSTGVVLMFGMGLGYSVIEMLQKRSGIQFLIVFEAEIDFFIQAMQVMDLTFLLTDKRVVICLGEPADLSSVMAPANRALMLENIHTLKLLPCFKVNPLYETISSEVFSHVNALNTEGTTKVLYGRTFVENRLKHLTSMHHDKKLEDLQGRFEKVPALIIAAGPSLDKNIDQISKAVGKAVIICVDTALPNLLNHGVVPDFVTSIDYKELTYEKIAPVAAYPACRQINLICTTWVTDMVPKIFSSKSIFWAFNNNALENWMNISLGGKRSVGGAGTVAHLNFTAAKTMGCDPIIFVGQDLAYSDSRSHASHVSLRSDEKIQKMLENGQEVMWVKGVVEPQVPTNRQMYGYKNTFEKMVAEFEGNVINATEGGAFIDGTTAMALATAIEKICQAEIVKDIQSVGKQIDLLTPVESTVGQLLKIEKLARKVKKTAKTVQQKLDKLSQKNQGISGFTRLPRDIQENVSVFDKFQKKIDKDPIWQIFDELTMENLRQDARQKKEIDALSGRPDKYVEWLVRSVERIDGINTIRMENIGWFKAHLNGLISHYKTEKSLMSRIENNENIIAGILDLADLHEQSRNYVLLEKLLEKYAGLEKTEEISAVCQYYYGVISLYREEYEKASKQFDTAVSLDMSLDGKIFDKRREIGEYYQKLAMSKKSWLTGQQSPVVENLLIKGLQCCPDHAGIRDIFRQFMQKDLSEIRLGMEKNQNPNVLKDLLQKWTGRFDNLIHLFDYMDKAVISEFYGFYGKILMIEKNYQNALDSFKKAREVNPEDPAICIALTDICFTLSDFDSGLVYLKAAVELDRQYAVYWRNIGKNLVSQNDFSGAVVAYENYFNALPENYDVLKDIGDCYQALGQLEAAREAYRQFKKNSDRQ